MGANDGGMSCPECGDQLPTEARFCPHCASAIAPDGSPIDPGDLDEIQSLVSIDERGRHRASRQVRALTGLAVSLPIAPLVLFLASSVLSLSWTTAIPVLLAGWICPAAYLSRSRAPAEAFGRGLSLIALGTALVPVAVSLRPDTVTGSGLTVEFGAITLAAMVIAGLCLFLGSFVAGQARRPVEDPRRASEDSSGN